MICLLMPSVTGRSRVPDPPASTIPFTKESLRPGAAAFGDELGQLHERVLGSTLGERPGQFPRPTDLARHRFPRPRQASVRRRDLEGAREGVAVWGALFEERSEFPASFEGVDHGER